MEILELKLLQNKDQLLSLVASLNQEETLTDQTQCLELSDALNDLALVLLNEDKVQDSLQYLRRAESLAGSSSRHKAKCYNTIASFYRKQGKIITALKYIERSIGLNPSGYAYLNLCAALNSQGKFDKALEISMHCIIFVQDEVIEEQVEQGLISTEKAEILTLAFYNLAVQLEYLKRSEEATSYYRKAVEFSSKYLPQGSCIREIIKQIFDKIISGTHKVELKPKEPPKVQVKRRVVIKSGKKSPISKSPLAQKDPDKKLTTANSHRKFVRVGITKAKFMEQYAAALKIENIESKDPKLAFLKNHSEISFKSKIKKNEENPENAVQRVQSEKLSKSPHNEETSKRDLPGSEAEVSQSHHVLNTVNSFEMPDHDESHPQEFLINEPNLSPVSRRHSEDEKFIVPNDENFKELINGEDQVSEKDSSQESVKINENWAGKKVNESDEEPECFSEREKLQKIAEQSLRFPMRQVKSFKESLFDSFQVPKKVNNSQWSLSKLL